MDLELGEEVLDVVADGGRAHVQALGHRPVLRPIASTAGHLELAPAQHRVVVDAGLALGRRREPLVDQRQQLLVAVTSRNRCTVTGPPAPVSATRRMLTLSQTGWPAFDRVFMSKLRIVSPRSISFMT